MRDWLPLTRLALATLAPLMLFAACSGDEDGSGQGACTYNSECAENQICAAGACVDECREARDCPAGEVCSRGACRSDGETGIGEPDADGDSGTGEDTTADADAGVDLAEVTDDVPLDTPAETDFGPRPVGFGTITGVVHFRLYDDTILPVSEPIVYWALPEDAPEPLSGDTTCDCGYPGNAVTGGADGSFILRDVPAGPIFLVVQKGMFRKYRIIDVPVDGSVDAPMSATELPVRNDPVLGDQVPDILIGTGRFDPVEHIFAKLRMGPVTPLFGFDYHAWMDDPTAWPVQLMVYQHPRELDDNDEELIAEPFLAALADEDRLNDFHITFAPCASYIDYASALRSEPLRDAIRSYVNEGGKLYATDFAYDIVEQVFAPYLDFGQRLNDGARPTDSANADGHEGEPAYMSTSASTSLRYESDNRALPGPLAGWLVTIEASDDGTLMTEGNWVNLRGVGTVPQCCDDGGAMVDITPDVIMNGPNFYKPFFGDYGPEHPTWEAANSAGHLYPHTVRFPYGCGEVMFSTYHTVEGDPAPSLMPQELVLLWLILEINECNLHPIKE